MLYTRKTFTLPSGNARSSQRQWDYSLLTKVEFLSKYGEDATEYAPSES